MSIQRNCHYVLTLIVLKWKVFILIDPLGQEEFVEKIYFSNFKRFLDQEELDSLGWIFHENDPYNCGVHLNYFLFKISYE